MAQAFNATNLRKKEAREKEALNKFIMEVETAFLDDLYMSQFHEWAEYAELFHNYKLWYDDRCKHWNFVKKSKFVKADPDYFINVFKPLEKPFKHGNKALFITAFRERFGLDQSPHGDRPRKRWRMGYRLSSWRARLSRLLKNWRRG